jgi:hypothetical protein
MGFPEQSLAASGHMRASDTPTTYDNCDVYWLEWPPRGSGQTSPTQCLDSGCTVTVKGKTATVVKSTGEVMVKRLGTRGFYFSPQVELTQEEEDALLSKL